MGAFLADLFRDDVDVLVALLAVTDDHDLHQTLAAGNLELAGHDSGLVTHVRFPQDHDLPVLVRRSQLLQLHDAVMIIRVEMELVGFVRLVDLFVEHELDQLGLVALGEDLVVRGGLHLRFHQLAAPEELHHQALARLGGGDDLGELIDGLDLLAVDGEDLVAVHDPGLVRRSAVDHAGDQDGHVRLADMNADARLRLAVGLFQLHEQLFVRLLHLHDIALAEGDRDAVLVLHGRLGLDDLDYLLDLDRFLGFGSGNLPLGQGHLQGDLGVAASDLDRRFGACLGLHQAVDQVVPALDRLVVERDDPVPGLEAGFQCRGAVDAISDYGTRITFVVGEINAEKPAALVC